MRHGKIWDDHPFKLGDKVYYSSDLVCKKEKLGIVIRTDHWWVTVDYGNSVVTKHYPGNLIFSYELDEFKSRLHN